MKRDSRDLSKQPQSIRPTRGMHGHTGQPTFGQQQAPNPDEERVGAPYIRQTTQPRAFIIPTHTTGRTADIPAVRPVRPRAKPPSNLRRRKILLFCLAGLLALPFLWVVVSDVVTWVGDEVDTMLHGYPRTAQASAVVGHNDSKDNPSFFFGVNLGGQISIVEWPGGDASHAKIYPLQPILGPRADKTVFSITFSDVNHDGKPDMLIGIGDTRVVYINDQGTFRPARPNELPAPTSFRGSAPADPLLVLILMQKEKPRRALVRVG
ncbi:MAG TPA: VCBS repeat-containing protein [Candidatus Acidoferrum sp.]|nr:VCBS repeat-containing protein [Candidatus Acidoferrum sp.]